MARRIFSAHIGYLFKEVPFADRFAVAAEAGFDAVEHPYDETFKAEAVGALLKASGLRFAQVPCTFGDAAKGEKGLAALPGRQMDFRAAFDAAFDFACAVGAPYVHPTAGIPDCNETAAAQDTYLENLHYAVERAAGTPVKILIEAISEAAVPGYALATLERACRVQDVFGPGNLSLLLDTFHAGAMGIDPAVWMAGNAWRLGHVHIADYPGRREPGSGAINFEAVLSTLDQQNVQAAIGFEFVPTASTAECLDFLAAWRARPDHIRRTA
jgi:hydroxypyruvate isomerase